MPLLKVPPDQTLILKGLKSYADNTQLNEFLTRHGCKTIFDSKALNVDNRAGSKIAYLNYRSAGDAKAALGKLLSSSVKELLPDFIDKTEFACHLKSQPPSRPAGFPTIPNPVQESDSGYSDESYESDVSSESDASDDADESTFATFLVKKLQDMPGGRINAAQVKNLACTRRWMEEIESAGGVKALCLDNVGRLKWIHDGKSGEVGLDTHKSDVNVGDAVKVVGKDLRFGRGDLHAWSIGKVISIKDNVCIINFPEDSRWKGHVSEVGKASEDEQRALSISPKDTKFGRCFFVREKSAGVFEFTGKADDNMRMHERQYGLVRGSSELNCGESYFEIEILHDNPNGIAIGFCGEDFIAGGQVGWYLRSVGYHSDDGNLFLQEGTGRTFGPTCGVGDRMGCGAIIGSLSTTVYFTRNGIVVGRIMVDIKSDENDPFPLFPTVTSASPATIRVHLEAQPPKGANEAACLLRTKLLEAKYDDDSRSWKSVTKQGPMRGNGDVPVTFAKYKDVVWVKPKNIRIVKGKEEQIDEQSFSSLELALALADTGDTIEVHDRGIHMMSKQVVIRKDLTIRGIPTSSGRPTISFSGGRVLDIRSNLTLREMCVKSVDGDKSASWSYGGPVGLIVTAGTADVASCTIKCEQGTGLVVGKFTGSAAKVLANKCDIGPCGRHGVLIGQSGSELCMLRITDIERVGVGINPEAGVLISESEISRCKETGVVCDPHTELVLIKSTTVTDCSNGIDLKAQNDLDDKLRTVKFVSCKISRCKEGINAMGQSTHVHWDESNTFIACKTTMNFTLGAKLHTAFADVDASSTPNQIQQQSPFRSKSPESVASSGVEDSSMKSEEENFWRFFRLVSNIGTQVMLCTFKEKYKQETRQDWSASLGPELFNSLPRRSLDKLGKQACEFIKAGESEKWDITLLSSLLLFEPGYLKDGSPEHKACRQIRDHRNELNHAKCFSFKCDNCLGTCTCGLGQPIMSNDDYNKLWTSVTAMIQSIVQTVLPKKEGDTFLSTIKTMEAQTIRVTETSNLRNQLFSEMKEYDEKLQQLEEKIVTKSFVHKAMESLAMLFRNGKVDRSKLPTTITLDNKKSYTLLKQAGHGGMGTVFEAVDHDSRSSVALKICDGGDEAHAEREVSNMRKLTEISSTENVVQFIDSAIHNSHYAIIMEFIVGKSLSQILLERSLPSQSGHMAWQETLPIMMQVAAGMAQVHKLKIAHRDLKPANIMMTDASKRIVIVDFGLSKQHCANQTLTSAGGPGGTTLYMSPEQTDDEGKVTDAQLPTDVWAMGIIWYEMLSGVTPFEPIKCDASVWVASSADVRSDYRIDMSSLSKKKESEIIVAIDQQPVPWERLPNDTPKEILNIIRKCLEKKKRDRYQNAQELLHHITDVSVQLQSQKTGNQCSATPSAVKPFKDWSVDEVSQLLSKCGFHEAAGQVKEDQVDGQTWLELEQQDEKEQEEIFTQHLKMSKLKRLRFRKERGG